MMQFGFLKQYLAASLVGALIGVGGYASFSSGDLSVRGAADGNWLDDLRSLNENGKAKPKGKQKAARGPRVPKPNINIPSAPNLANEVDQDELNEMRRKIEELTAEPILDRYDPEECARNFIQGQHLTTVVGRVRKASLKPMPYAQNEEWTCTVSVLPKGCNESYEAYATSAFAAGEVDSYCNAAFVAASNNTKVVMVTRKLLEGAQYHSPRIVEFNAYAVAEYEYDLDRARRYPSRENPILR